MPAPGQMAPHRDNAHFAKMLEAMQSKGEPDLAHEVAELRKEIAALRAELAPVPLQRRVPPLPTTAARRNEMIQLGDKVKDGISGFTGIAVARTEWLHGCMRVTVQPDKVDKDGKVPDNATFDEPQLVLVKAKIVPIGSRKTGGPVPNQKQKAGPVR